MVTTSAAATRSQLRRIRTAAAVLGVLAVGAMAASSAPACACGIAFRARSSGERALVTYRSGIETIIPSLTLSRVGSDASVLFPVPGVPHVRALGGVDDLFTELELATAPSVGSAGATPGAASPAPPRVISSRVVGGYRVSVLAATSSSGLAQWLRGHHYAPPPGSRPILSSYIARGWRFVAIRLARTAVGSTKPLAISFRSARIVYPERLSALSPEGVNLELFVDASGPVRSLGMPGLETVASSRVAELNPAPDAAVRALLPAPELTRLQATQLPPRDIRSDVTAVVTRGDAASDGGPLGGSPGGVPVTIVLLAMAGVALVVAALLSLRIFQRRHRTSSAG